MVHRVALMSDWPARIRPATSRKRIRHSFPPLSRMTVARSSRPAIIHEVRDRFDVTLWDVIRKYLEIVSLRPGRIVPAIYKDFCWHVNHRDTGKHRVVISAPITRSVRLHPGIYAWSAGRSVTKTLKRKWRNL